MQYKARGGFVQGNYWPGGASLQDGGSKAKPVTMPLRLADALARPFQQRLQLWYMLKKIKIFFLFCFVDDFAGFIILY